MQPPADRNLRGERQRSFLERGFAVFRGLLADELEVLRAGVDELVALPETPGRIMKYFDPVPEVPGQRLLNRIENFVPYHPALDAIVRGPKLIGAVSELLGEPVVLFKDKINLKLPGGEGFEPHQDVQAGWEEYASLFVTAAVAIDAPTRANGCLELAAWAHRRVRIGPLFEPLGPEELRELEFEPLPMAPGDTVCFDGYLPHRSGPNRSPHARSVLYVTYNRAAEGDHRARYYADKRQSYPPDCERIPGRTYRYRV